MGVQRLVEHFSRARVGNDARLYVIASILQNAHVLCADEYGHFAVETLLEFGDASERSIIVGALQMVYHGKASYVMKKVIDLKLLPRLQAPQSELHTSTECDDSDSDEEIAPPLGLSSSMKPGSFAPPGVFFKSGLDTDHCCSSGLVTIGLPPGLSLTGAGESEQDKESCCSTAEPDDDVVLPPEDELQPTRISMGADGHVAGFAVAAAPIAVACSTSPRMNVTLASASGNACRRSKGTGREPNYQCWFEIGIDQDDSFNVKARIIGNAGKHMKDIVHYCGDNTKLRLRGQGSGFLEGRHGRESKDPLMLCVSAPSEFSCNRAKRMITELLENIYEEYRAINGSAPTIRLHDGARPGAF